MLANIVDSNPPLLVTVDRALGSVISKFKYFRNVGFKTYSKLYHLGVIPILDYCSGVWGFKKGIPAIRYFLGVHSKTPILALEGDTGWLIIEVRVPF